MLVDHHIAWIGVAGAGWVVEVVERAGVLNDRVGDAGLLDEVGQQVGRIATVQSEDQQVLVAVGLPDTGFDV